MGPFPDGDEGNRTPDPLLAKQVLSQLSYTPVSGAFPLFPFPDASSAPSKLNNAKPNSFAELEFLRYSSYLASP